MIDLGKKNILGVLINAIDYHSSVKRIIEAAKNQNSLIVSALAVHGVMTGVMDNEHRYRLNNFDLIVPDGQPVRWALNILHKTELKDRVYGPNLTLKVCEAAAMHDLPVYFYGSKQEVLECLIKNLLNKYPNLKIAGYRPSLFRKTTIKEKELIVKEIKESGAKIVFVGLGCPRQEVWAYEYRNKLPMPLLAVGAAFDFHSGNLAQAPKLLQKYGLEWVFRLYKEPKRLWKRYLILNPIYLYLISLQYFNIKPFPVNNTSPPEQEIMYG